MMSSEIVLPIIVGLAAGVVLIILLASFTGVSPLQRNYDTAVITLERTACYGTCPGYSLTIFGNGTVNYEGRRYTAIVGKHTYTVPRGNVSRLVDYFYGAGFLSMKDNYGLCIDCPKYTASLTMDDRTKTVIYNRFTAPPSLISLDTRIDDYAGSYEWVNCPEGKRVATVDQGRCR